MGRQGNGGLLMDYVEFLERKTQLGGFHGFDPLWMPDCAE